MSLFTLNKVAAPSTPAANKAILYIDQATAPYLRMKNEAGTDLIVSGIMNQSTVGQAPAAATRTYVTGSNLLIPTVKLQVGACFEWTMHITKTGAGTAASTFDVCVGTAGTTADTARLSFTKPAGTAVIDDGIFTIKATVKTAGASGILVGSFWMIHNLQTTGHAVIPCVVVPNTSGAFDMTVANLIVGVCVTSGTADAITITQVHSNGWNL